MEHMEKRARLGNKAKGNKMADTSIPRCGTHKPRDMGYTEWMAWAENQFRQGIRQSQCPICTRWLFPEEQTRREGKD